MSTTKIGGRASFETAEASRLEEAVMAALAHAAACDTCNPGGLCPEGARLHVAACDTCTLVEYCPEGARLLAPARVDQ